MFDLDWMADLDRGAALDAAAANHRALLEREATGLYLAVHWADLYSLDPDTDGPDTGSGGSAGAGGRERFKRLGGPGTPEVAEFAAAEFGAVQDMHPFTAEALIRDGLNLRHRHPLLWALLRAAGVREWQARQVAKMVNTAGLSLEQALWVDAQTTGALEGTPWGRFKDLVAAKIIEADPTAAAARANAAAADQFVAAGQCNEHGLKTIIAKAQAGDVIWFIATVNRIAAILATNGDTTSIGVRRARAIGILANPAQALQLLADFADDLATHRATDNPQPTPENPTTRDGTDGTDGTDGDDNGAGDDGSDEGAGSGNGSDAAEGADDPEVVGEGDVHPSENDADDPKPETHPCPTCAGTGTVSGDPSVFTQPVRIDPTKLLPRAILYVHLNQDSFTRDSNGVARFEGVGPITTAAAAEFLGTHCQVTIKPVIDLAHQVPVDGYETPAAMAEALHLRTPADIFPFAVNTGRKKDKDHTIPYLAPDKGGPPGQTHLGNLGPMIRFHHRIRTHSRWALKQPEPGVYLWRSPHGWIYLVDHNGTHRLGNTSTAQNFYATARATTARATNGRATGRATDRATDPGGGATGSGNTRSVELIPTDDIIEYDPTHSA